jgi:hypothetical protein
MLAELSSIFASILSAKKILQGLLQQSNTKIYTKRAENATNATLLAALAPTKASQT